MTPAELKVKDVTHLTERAGVYLLYEGDKLQYVGQSKTSFARVQKHRVEGRIPFDRVYMHFCLESEMTEVELSLMRMLRPPYNRRVAAELDERDFTVFFRVSKTQREMEHEASR